MNVPRSILRAQRVVRIPRNPTPIRRYATENAKPAASGAVTGGLVGGLAAFGVGYAFYHFSGAKTAVQTAKQAKSYVDSTISAAKLELPEKMPRTDEAIQMLQDTANRYAMFIPGGRGYVDSVFQDLKAIRKRHGDEVDKIIREAYEDLREVSSKGVSLDAAGEAVDVLANHASKLYAIAGDAAEDILENHPDLKKKVGGSSEQIKKFSEQYGQEAKKQLDEVRGHVRDITKNGLNWETLEKIQKLIIEKTGEIKEQGQDAVKRGAEEAKPLLDNVDPKIKKFVQDNMQSFKDGNIMEAIDAVNKAISSKDTKPLEEFIKK